MLVYHLARALMTLLSGNPKPLQGPWDPNYSTLISRQLLRRRLQRSDRVCQPDPRHPRNDEIEGPALESRTAGQVLGALGGGGLFEAISGHLRASAEVFHCSACQLQPAPNFKSSRSRIFMQPQPLHNLVFVATLLPPGIGLAFHAETRC